MASRVLIDTGLASRSTSLLVCPAGTQLQGLLVPTDQVELDRGLYCPRCEQTHAELIDLATAVELGIVAANENTDLVPLDLRELIAAAMRAAA